VVCVSCLVVSEEVGSPKRSCAVDPSPSDDCPDDDDDTPAPPEGGDDPCGLGCWDPPELDDPFDPPGFMSVQSWQTTSSGMAVAVYQPASAECEEEQIPTERASKNEVENLIMEECSGQSLPNDLSGYFEASVIKSVNDRLFDPTRLFLTDGQEEHPQLFNPVDGYAEGVKLDGVPLPGVLSTIIEVKFTSTPVNNMSSGQYEAHIDGLAMTYDLVPGGFDQRAPQYSMITLSQYDNLEYFGGGKGEDMKAYAASKGVNVFHGRVTKDDLGNMYIEGKQVGVPQDWYTWLRKLFVNTQIPFTVSCEPA